MGFDKVARAPSPIERRAAERTRVSCPVRLQTPAGQWAGQLWDLSETGARVQVENPPAQGATALIAWQQNELFCRVAWSAGDMCGVVFERPVSRSVVHATLGEPERAAESAPAASVANIPVGKRRSRLRRSDEA